MDLQHQLTAIRVLADRWSADESPVYPRNYLRGYLIGKCSVLRSLASDTLLRDVIACEDYGNEQFDLVEPA